MTDIRHVLSGRLFFVSSVHPCVISDWCRKYDTHYAPGKQAAVEYLKLCTPTRPRDDRWPMTDAG